jgi:hypothetical protein
LRPEADSGKRTGLLELRLPNGDDDVKGVYDFYSVGCGAGQSMMESQETTSTTAEETGLKLVRLGMPPEVHRQFRVEAAKEGLGLAAMSRRLVEEWTAKHESGGK